MMELMEGMERVVRCMLEWPVQKGLGERASMEHGAWSMEHARCKAREGKPGPYAAREDER
jgi:hypothetical protein